MAALIKFLMLAVVVVGVLYLLRGRRKAKPDQDAPPASPDRKAQPPAMVSCAHCGVHLPDDDAVKDGESRSFCSEAHRLAGPR